MDDAFIADFAQAQASKVEAERRQADEARQAKLRAAAKAELLQMQRELQVGWIGGLGSWVLRATRFLLHQVRRSQGRCLTPTTRLQLYTALGDARLLPIGGRQAKKLPAVDQTPHRRTQTPLHSPLATPLGGLSTPFATRRLVARRLVACHETSEGSARLILPLLPSLLA